MKNPIVPRRERSSWFFSKAYVGMAIDNTVDAEVLPKKGLGLIARRNIPRRNIICYFPTVCRNVDEDLDFTYALQIFTRAGDNCGNHILDVPLNAHANEAAPRWRSKPVLGHLVNEAREHERKNAAIVFPVQDEPLNSTFHYVPLVATRDINAGEEILLNYGPWYERRTYTTPADAPSRGQRS